MDRFDRDRGFDGTHAGDDGSGLTVPASFVREALVARLKREVQDGSYRVDRRAVAARMLPVLFPNAMGA